MDIIAIAIGSSWTLASLLIIAISIPLVRGQVRPNHYYGIRFPNSFQSDDAWYAINRFGGKKLILWSLPLLLLGLITFFLPLQKNTPLTLILGFAPLIFIFIPFFQSQRFARNYQPNAD